MQHRILIIPSKLQLMHKEIILMEKTSFKGFNQRAERDFNVGNNCSIADRSLFKTNVYFCVSRKSAWYYMKQKHRNVISSVFVTRFSLFISVIRPWAAFSVNILYLKEKKEVKANRNVSLQRRGGCSERKRCEILVTSLWTLIWHYKH